MKKILGLDLGTNSIGWAVINASDNGSQEELAGISSSGSRIIPMDAAAIGDFCKGNSKSQTAERTEFRGKRRLYERSRLRRERLLRVLSLMGFLPIHYAQKIDRYGKFIGDEEPKIAWVPTLGGKFEFLFEDSFREMVAEFKSIHAELLGNGKKIPYDWTLYYLRKKALSRKISKAELAWVLLSFNQKRGYHQLRGEEENAGENKSVKYETLKVVAVEDSGIRKGNKVCYNIQLENGLSYSYFSSIPLDWEGKIKDFVVTTELDKNGQPQKDKDGGVKRSIRVPKEDDWGLIKAKTQEKIKESGKTVGAFIYDAILESPDIKVRGKLVSTIDRECYKTELDKILEKQQEFHKELLDKELLELCVENLYPHNDAHRNLLTAKDFRNFLVNDIVFYQRPLKSKKTLIDDCPYEYRVYKKDGEICRKPLKCVSKSHPLFQELRLWQFIGNLRIYQKEKTVGGSLKTDVDVTAEFLKEESDYVALFERLNEKKSIKQDSLLADKPFELGKKERANYRWNYVEGKEYPCNETHYEIQRRLKKANVKETFLKDNKGEEEKLWHMFYSISDRRELVSALEKYARRFGFDEKFAEVFSSMPPFESNYAAYSLKAVRKLLALVRMGSYWNENAIDANTRKRIEKIVTGEYDASISDRVREKSLHLQDMQSFRGLPLWLACYVVYDRHSESKENARWETPGDIDVYLKNFKQHSLRNPIVEQVVTETLRTVRDIWKQEGRIDEIHIELGREMKNPADKRKKMTEQAMKNENTNLRIKALLTEFMNPEFGIENVRPYSPSQQELLRIYEEGVMQSVSGEKLPDDISNILKKFNETEVKKRPTASDVNTYKLWLEQKYRSPYTGKIIPLGKLFTPAYEIEHIIPQSRYFDDSLSNKVICEAAVNKLKSNLLGYEFVKKHGGEKVELGLGENVTVFTCEEYEKFVGEHYDGNGSKKRKLLLEDIPDSFIERQLNDSRYISRVVMTLLSNVVREPDEQEAVSKNVIVCTGGITDRLKKDWGIQDAWNRIVLPRFKRMNDINNCTDYTALNRNGHVIPNMPLEHQKGFNKKRIDHRHHAMDAIVIACANRNIVNYLNNASARKNAEVSRRDLQYLLCDKVKDDGNGNYRWIIRKPWDTFTQDAYNTLLNIVASFKQNLRVTNCTSNYYMRYSEDGKKIIAKQTKGGNRAIRKPMHKDTVFGEVNLRKVKSVTLKTALLEPKRIVDKDLKRKIMELLNLGCQEKEIKKYFTAHEDVWADINLKKIEVYYFTNETEKRFYATRKPLDESFNQKKIDEEITDTGIQRILSAHLLRHNSKADVAFSAEGIEDMNQHIQELNGGKFHKPIYKARVYEEANKFAVGKKGNKCRKFVEAAKGTNLFFAVYEQKTVNEKTGETIRKRTYNTIPLNIVIDRQKNGLSSVPEDENGNAPVFVLSPNDLVYLPTETEIRQGRLNMPLDRERIYKMVSSSKYQCCFVKCNVSNPIVDKVEFSSRNKMEKAITGEMIKETCIPLKTDRLGNISLMDSCMEYL